MVERDTVQELERDVFSVPYYHLCDAETVLVGETEYAICVVPGITTDRLVDSEVWNHKIGTLRVPLELARKRAIFRIVQEDSYLKKGNLIKVVRDVELARKIVDAFMEQESRKRWEQAGEGN